MRSFVLVVLYSVALWFVTPALAAVTSAEPHPPSGIGAHKVTASLTAQALATRPPEAVVEAPPPAAPDEIDPVNVARLVVDALGSKNWSLLACAGVLAVVYLARRFGAAFWPWLRSDMGGVVLSSATAILLTLTSTLSAGKPFSLSLLLGAILTAAGASGFWSWGKKLMPKPAVAKS